jgi:hypothetical protein
VPKGGVGLVDHLAERGGIDLVRDQPTEHGLGDLGIGLAREARNRRAVEGRPLLRDIEPAIAGKPGQERVHERQRLRFAPGRNVKQGSGLSMDAADTTVWAAWRQGERGFRSAMSRLGLRMQGGGPDPPGTRGDDRSPGDMADRSHHLFLTAVPEPFIRPGDMSGTPAFREQFCRRMMGTVREKAMRSMIKALVVAAGLAGFAASAQAAPVSSAESLGVAGAPIVHVQMDRMERRMVRRHVERRMMRRHMERRMMRHRMERRMMHRM